MAVRLPPHLQSRYEGKMRRRGDRWGFLLVAAAVLLVLEFIGDQGVISLQWLTTLPASLGFTMFEGHPVRRHQGFDAPLFTDPSNDG